MDEISQWFEDEFGHLGFMITPLMYDPENFIPVRGVLWRRPDGNHIKTNIGIYPELVADLAAVVEYKSLLRDAVNNFLESQGYIKDFKPKKKINKLKI